MTTLQRQAWAIIRTQHGRSQAVSSRVLSDRLGVKRPVARRVVRELIMEHGKAIAACGTGYFIPETEDERSAYIADLTGRIRGIAARLRSFDANAHRQLVQELRQPELIPY